MVLDDSRHGVEEDEDDDQPEPPLLFAHSPHPELELLKSEHDSCSNMTSLKHYNNVNQRTSPLHCNSVDELMFK